MIFTSVITLFMLVGCNTMTGEEDARDGDYRTNVEQTRYNDGNMDNRGVGNDERMRNDRQGDNRNASDRERNGEYDVSQKAADAITEEIPEVEGAYVITMGSNAYVAARFDDDQGNESDNTRNEAQNNGTTTRHQDSDQLTDDLKEEIASIVREQDDTITNVYVTTNPEFSNLTRDYMDDLDNGRPVRGFFDQVGQMIERIFPENQR